MKLFEITFTDDVNSGIYSSNLCYAATMEDAKSYFQTLGDYEIIGVRESETQPKPGQPIHTVPDCWEISDENEESTRSKEEIVSDIIEYFKDNEDEYNNAIEELDDYNGYLNDDRYYSMYDINELHAGLQPVELLRRAFYGYDEDTYTTDSYGNRTYGAFNPDREYFRFNGYGNLVSSNYKDYSGLLDSHLIDDLYKYRYQLYCIDDNTELSVLFDELEAIEE